MNNPNKLVILLFTLFESLAGGTDLYELTDICLHIVPVKGFCHGLVHPVSSRMTYIVMVPG